MKRVTLLLALTLVFSGCKDDDAPLTINSQGTVKLENLDGLASEGWGVGALVVSNDGTTIYYAMVNYQTDEYSIRKIDEDSNVTTILHGDGQIDALDISNDDSRILYSISNAETGTVISKMYEYPFQTQINALLLTVQGDGYFWDLQYLPDGNIVYTQGNGIVEVSLRRMERENRQVTVLMDKELNPLLRDVDEVNNRLLVEGWTSSRIMTLDFDGGNLIDYGSQTRYIRPLGFSPDGSKILASEVVSPNDANLAHYAAVSYDVNTGEKTLLTESMDNNLPLAFGENDQSLILDVDTGNGEPGELFFYDVATQVYTPITTNDMFERFHGFYGNSYDRVIFSARNTTENALFIHNK
ncbi:hypothetical protein [Roseivirga sp.]|uniref:hypothetical protein n=1 Tax=Roseivirga sp. TaxID=1964215 RepID=UPI003B51BBC0